MTNRGTPLNVTGVDCLHSDKALQTVACVNAEEATNKTIRCEDVDRIAIDEHLNHKIIIQIQNPSDDANVVNASPSTGTIDREVNEEGRSGMIPNLSDDIKTSDTQINDTKPKSEDMYSTTVEGHFSGELPVEFNFSSTTCKGKRGPSKKCRRVVTPKQKPRRYRQYIRRPKSRSQSINLRQKILGQPTINHVKDLIYFVRVIKNLYNVGKDLYNVGKYLKNWVTF